MVIRKCNLCKKEVKNYKDMIDIRYGWNTEEFCLDCGKKMLSKQGQKQVIKSN